MKDQLDDLSKEILKLDTRLKAHFEEDDKAFKEITSKLNLSFETLSKKVDAIRDDISLVKNAAFGIKWFIVFVAGCYGLWEAVKQHWKG